MKTILSLDGLWRYTPELECRPENNSNLTEGPIYADPRLNRKDWERGPVPGVWNRYAEVYRLFEGVMWFSREIDLPAPGEDAKARLRFKGVSYRADVYVNGVLAGVHESSYTEFTVDVTGPVKPGTNLIALRVDNRAALRKWPCDRGYFSYGGIYRSVFLELVETGDIDHADVTPVLDDNGDGLLRISGQLHAASCGSVTVRMGEREDALPVSADGSFSGELRYPGVTPWTPDAPYLYDLSLTAGTDTNMYRVGYKRLTSRDGKLCLNGTPYRMKGVCYVFDSPETGLTATEEALRRDLGEMKAGGVNAIRLHFPMNDRFYELCDEMGFLVWAEIPVYCYHPKKDTVNTYFSRPEYVENAKMIVREMIAAARCHPSVAFYSIGNECFVDHPEAGPFFRALSALVRSLDDTRLVSFAALYGLVASIGDVIDVIGLNSYFGWYDRISDLYAHEDAPAEGGALRKNEPDLAPLRSLLAEVIPQLPADMPILMTEFGADSIPGCYSSAADLWSEEYHAEVIRDTIALSKEYDRICGTFIFCFTDYLDPSKPRNGFWNYENLKGMLSYNRDRKLPWYAMREAYTEGV